MLSSVLRSDTAIEVNIRIMRAFTSMRHFLQNNAEVFQRLSTMEYHQLEMQRQFQLDIDRHNAQYAPIDVETFHLSHDRFLCIDDDVYHIGASIKDLGKKWFGFSKAVVSTST